MASPFYTDGIAYLRSSLDFGLLSGPPVPKDKKRKEGEKGSGKCHLPPEGSSCEGPVLSWLSKSGLFTVYHAVHLEVKPSNKTKNK